MMRLKIHILIIIVLLSLGELLYSVPGYYIEPKFSFYEYLNKYDVKRVKNYKPAFGYGLSLGYDFSRLESAVPVRLELEYIGNHAFTETRTRVDYLFFNAYYDIHFYYITRSELAYRITGEVYRSVPFLSVYLGPGGGMAVGTKLTTPPENSDGMRAISSDIKYTYALSLNAGFMIHFTKYIGLNFGYKWIYKTPLYRDGHEVLVGLRFTIPDVSMDFDGFLSRE